MNLVQLVFYPLVATLGIIGLAIWLRDLTVPEWDILIDNPFLIQILTGIILGFIVVLGIFIYYCVIKLFRLLTKFVSEDELENEFKRLKNKKEN